MQQTKRSFRSLTRSGRAVSLVALAGFLLAAGSARAQQSPRPDGAEQKTPDAPQESEPPADGESRPAAEDGPKSEPVRESDAGGEEAAEPQTETAGATDETAGPGASPAAAEGKAAAPPPAGVAPPAGAQGGERPRTEGSSLESDASEGLEDLSLVELFQLDLRVATTKTNTTVQASPADVIVISREQIERYGYRSVADALRDVVGTYMVDDHITPNLGVRGAPGTPYEGSGAVKVMIDNVPVAFRTTGENWLGPALVPMASVERIEVVKGPTSSLYGADAFLGVINVITKSGAQKSWGEVGLTGMMSTNGGPGGHIEAASELVMRPWRFSFGAQLDQEDRSGLSMPQSSPAPTLADTAGITSRDQVLRSGVALFQVSHTPNRKTTYSLSGRYAQQKTGAEFAPWLQFTNVPGEDTGTWTSLHQGTLTMKAGSSFTKQFRLEAMATGFFGSTLPDDRIDTGDSLALVHRDLSYAGGEGMVEAIVEPSQRLRFVLGVEGTADREHLGAPDYFSRDDGSALPPVGATEDFERTLFNIAGRAQATWHVIPEYLVPTAGLRFDHNSIYGDRVSGRIAVVSHVYGELYLKASFGTAFKAATPLLLFGQPLTTGDVIGSPELGPQENRSLELTVDYRPKKIADLQLTGSMWHLIDRAVFRPEEINLVARNAANATGWTLEAQASSTFSDVVGGSLGFEWVSVTQESGETGYRGELFGTDPAIYPDFIARGRVWVQPRPVPIEIWAASNVVGSRNASDDNTLEAGERYVLPTYATLDAGLRTVDLRWFGERLTEFSLRGQNLLGTAGSAAGFFGIDYPAPPTQVMLEARQEF